MTPKLLLSAATALTLLAVAQPVQAVSLSSLIGGGPVTSGGLVFSNFQASGTLPPSGVDVTFTSTGIQFTGTWTTAGSDSTIIQYDVATVSGTLSGTTLNMAGSSVSGNASASVGETVTDFATNNTYSLQTIDLGSGNPANTNTASVTFNPEVTNIHIVKSVDVAAAVGASATLNFVENIYTNSGQNPPVPEPMTLALIPLALAALGLRKKLSS